MGRRLTSGALLSYRRFGRYWSRFGNQILCGLPDTLSDNAAHRTGQRRTHDCD